MAPGVFALVFVLGAFWLMRVRHERVLARTCQEHTEQRQKMLADLESQVSGELADALRERDIAEEALRVLGEVAANHARRATAMHRRAQRAEGSLWRQRLLRSLAEDNARLRALVDGSGCSCAASAEAKCTDCGRNVHTGIRQCPSCGSIARSASDVRAAADAGEGGAA